MILTKAKIPKRQSAWRESPGTWGICSTLSKSYRGLQRWWGQSGRTGWLSPPSRRDRRSWLGRPYMEKWSKAHHMFGLEAPEAWAAWWEDASRQWKLSPRHTPGLQPALHFQIGLIEGNTSNKGKRCTYTAHRGKGTISLILKIPTTWTFFCLAIEPRPPQTTAPKTSERRSPKAIIANTSWPGGKMIRN